MIPVVMYSNTSQEVFVRIGSLPPSEISILIDIIKEHGAIIGDSDFSFASSSYDLKNKRMEIIIEPNW